MRPERLGVVGLGAVGGSVALGATEAGVTVTGYSRLPAEGVAAARVGAIRHVALSLEDLVREVELLVLCAPPTANPRILERIAPAIHERRILVTDVTSVKQPIMRAARRLQVERWFAGSHPLAGTHESGFDAAHAEMIRDALVYVTPGAPGDPTAREIGDFWETVFGASVVFIDPEEHDHRLAWTSHLPQAVASALAVAMARGGPRGATWGAGALDTTRLAQSSVEMWSAVLRQNRAPVLEALGRTEEAMAELREALERDDPKALKRWLREGARFRRGLDT